MITLQTAVECIENFNGTVEYLNKLFINTVINMRSNSRNKLILHYFVKYVELLQIEPIKNCDIDLKWINPYYSDPINVFNMKNLVTIYFDKNLQCNVALVSDEYIAKVQKTELPIGKYIVCNGSLYFYKEQNYAVLDLHKSYKRVGKINLSATPLTTEDKNGFKKEYYQFEMVNLDYAHCKQYNKWFVYTYHQTKPVILTQTPEMYPEKFVVIMPIIV